jgi:hypothetical protein
MHIRRYRLLVARLFSIIGHPAIVTPGAMLLALHARHAASSRLIVYQAFVIAIAAGLMMWGLWQVRRQRWLHIDASAPSERRDLNRVTFRVLVASAIGSAVGHIAILSLGFACASLILAIAIILAGTLKLSQHVAFAMLSSFIAGFAGIGAVAAMLAFTLAIAWSRVELGRHTRLETLSGAGAGLLAGLVLVTGISVIG